MRHVDDRSTRALAGAKPWWPQQVWPVSCLACRSDEGVQSTGFCVDCIDRSRVIAADELGGEC